MTICTTCNRTCNAMGRDAAGLLHPGSGCHPTSMRCIYCPGKPPANVDYELAPNIEAVFARGYRYAFFDRSDSVYRGINDPSVIDRTQYAMWGAQPHGT